jgi:asparagine synthase (glutamine-hydrolysing)
MCGVAGFVGKGGRADLKKMMAAIAHRGPDEEGFFHESDSGLYVGHLRLSILDLESGSQPMWNKNRTIAVSFNGEIYNHTELRAELEGKGHKFHTSHSDTEVLVHGWEEWGEELPGHLNGMFGFAIWDGSRKIVFLARDRFGEKPMYWAQQNGTFFFASELGGITAHSRFQARYNHIALKKYFAHGFVPSPHSIYRDSMKLSPGSWLKFDLASCGIKIKAFWRYRTAPVERPPTLDEAAEEIRSLFLQSTKKRLMSDVPLGVFLSGGVDSSFTTAAICKFRNPKGVQSFSIGFEEKSYDESNYAREVASALGTSHHESILGLGKAKQLIDEVLSALDEPLGDPSILPTVLLSRFTRSQVKVALSGDGGDELFGGYDPFAALAPSALYQAMMPNLAHRGLRKLVDLLPKSGANMSLDFKLRRVLQGLDFGPELWNPVWLAPLEPKDIECIFNEPVDIEELYSEALALWREVPSKNTVDKTLDFYGNLYLSDNILTKVDRAAMQNGLEVRSVFLDNDLVDFSLGLPAKYKFDGKTRKIVLKKAAAGLVPSLILDRPKKGFGVPLKAWLEDIPISGEKAEKFDMTREMIDSRIRGHQNNGEDHRLFLWNWLVLDKFSSV